MYSLNSNQSLHFRSFFVPQFVLFLNDCPLGPFHSYCQQYGGEFKENSCVMLHNVMFNIWLGTLGRVIDNIYSMYLILNIIFVHMDLLRVDKFRCQYACPQTSRSPPSILRQCNRPISPLYTFDFNITYDGRFSLLCVPLIA